MLEKKCSHESSSICPDAYTYYRLGSSVEMSNGVIVLCNIYETLLKYDPLNKEFIPVLATDYRKSDDVLSGNLI